MKFRPFIQDKYIDWVYLSENPAAIHLLEPNLDKVSWDLLSQNPAAIHLLEANPEKIVWYNLSQNPAPGAIKLLAANPEKIDWYNLSRNPSIFEYDYQAMKDRMYNSGLCEDLMKNRFHPKNIYKFESWGHESLMEEEKD